MKIVLLGPQGAGKGTVAKELAKKYNIPHVDMGKIFRDAANEGSDLGLKAKGFWEKGILVPNEITNGLMKERLQKEDVRNGFVLDGFPRNLNQAEALDKVTDIEFIFVLQVEEATSIQRLSGRRICKKCDTIYHVTNIPPKVEGVCDKCGGELYQREDDLPAAIKKRLELYHSETQPVVDYYGDRVIKINAEGDYRDYIKTIIKHIEGE